LVRKIVFHRAPTLTASFMPSSRATASLLNLTSGEMSASAQFEEI
jgi:hypothetical protein